MLDGMTPPKNKVNRCKIATTTEELEPADSEIFAAAIIDARKWPAQTLATELRIRGLIISDGSIHKHRKKSCACYREIG
tara:strand:+ start:142 stop:378 length:237 start_codon:yes stop_codon:yes gene_type:complete